MTRHQRNLLVATVALALGCINYEYTTDGGAWFRFTGLRTTASVLTLVGLVALWRVYRAVMTLAASRGIESGWGSSKMKWLFPVFVLLIAPTYRQQGEYTTGVAGDLVPRRVFVWADPDYKGLFLVALGFALLMHRLLRVLRSLERHQVPG